MSLWDNSFISEKDPSTWLLYTNPKVMDCINSKVYRPPASLQARIFRQRRWNDLLQLGTICSCTTLGFTAALCSQLHVAGSKRRSPSNQIWMKVTYKPIYFRFIMLLSKMISVTTALLWSIISSDSFNKTWWESPPSQNKAQTRWPWNTFSINTETWHSFQICSEEKFTT